jgi:hypothetical protein
MKLLIMQFSPMHIWILCFILASFTFEKHVIYFFYCTLQTYFERQTEKCPSCIIVLTSFLLSVRYVDRHNAQRSASPEILLERHTLEKK